MVGLTLPILRVLQLLCENHNHDLRNYLRRQPDNIESINLVKEVVVYLEVVYTEIDKDSIILVTQALDTLNEFSMGNVENQHLLFDSGVLDIVNNIIREPKKSFFQTTVECSPSQVADLMKKTFTLVKTMLDGNDQQTRKLSIQVAAILDLEAVFQTIVSAFFFV